eukprot:3934767-Rhodomonas_salina.4
MRVLLLSHVPVAQLPECIGSPAPKLVQIPEIKYKIPRNQTQESAISEAKQRGDSAEQKQIWAPNLGSSRWISGYSSGYLSILSQSDRVQLPAGCHAPSQYRTLRSKPVGR